ncbi:MAG: NAD+ synthase, partial [Candidatus Bathyarchaeota archaeon]|nr:NAD+ synthase [Candidatus Bathyarchaeota archaeon]
CFLSISMLNLSELKLDATKTSERITQFIRHEIEKSGLNGALVSVSGGIDSAVTLALTVRALGSDRVRALTMPERDITPERDLADVMRLARRLDVTCDTVEITPVMAVMREILPLYDPSDLVAFGNVKSRVRMALSYHYANSLGYMVIGSSNRTEWMTGYFTKHGDGGVDLMPLADLYKNQIRQLAIHLDLPVSIMEKAPSAGFWPGQTDEGELGVDYDTLDLVLHGVEKGMSEEEVAEALDADLTLVKGIFGRVRANEHKRRLPTILRLRTDSG